MHLHAITVEVTTDSPGLSQRADTCQVNRRVELLTREGCMICSGAATRLKQLADELGFELAVTDVDAVAAAGDSALRAEFGDRLPVVLLDGAEHSYWEVDEPRLRADLARG
jgi:glutaredoxin